MMNQIQLRNIKEDDLDYDLIVHKGLLDVNTGYLYLLDSIEQRMFSVNIKSVNYEFIAIEDNNDLTGTEIDFLTEFAKCKLGLYSYTRRKDAFEGELVAKTKGKVSLFEKIDIYAGMLKDNVEYKETLTRIEELTNQIEGLQKSYKEFLISNDKESGLSLESDGVN